MTRDPTDRLGLGIFDSLISIEMESWERRQFHGDHESDLSPARWRRQWGSLISPVVVGC
jgi:hypothetical protein